MKNHLKIYGLVIVTLAIAVTACEDELENEVDESLKASLDSVYIPSGFTEGEINETIEVSVVFNHPLPDMEVKEIVKNVMDSFTTEYIIISGKKSVSDNSNSTSEMITVSYDITETGAHRLNFYYELQDIGEKEFIGHYEFAINN